MGNFHSEIRPFSDAWTRNGELFYGAQFVYRCLDEERGTFIFRSVCLPMSGRAMVQLPTILIIEQIISDSISSFVFCFLP